MGGDGKVKKPETWYSHWRVDFFRSHSFVDGTVRLAGDVEQMKQAQGITEQLKVENVLEWIGRMNNIQVCAREIVDKGMIYQ